MNKKRKKYLVTAEDSETLACSLVTNPAIEELFVAFSEQEPLKTQFSDDSKHIVVGAVAIPNFEIYRRDENGNEYDIVFSEEAIEKMSRDFLRNYRQKDVTLQHNETAEGVWLVEQWIKTDMVYDKSLALGLSNELPKGTWFQAYYVDSNEIWQRVQSGELRGFSLECALGLEEFNKQYNIKDIEEMSIENYKEKGLFDAMKTAFKEAMKEEKLASEENLTPSEKEVKKELNNIDENITVAEVKLEEETATATETVTETPTVETPTIETPVEEPKVETPTIETPVEEPKVEEHNPLADVVENLKTELESLRKMNEDLMAKVADLNKQPSAKPINTNTSGGLGGNTAFQNWREQLRNML